MNKPYTDSEVGCYLYGIATKAAPVLVATYVAGYTAGQAFYRVRNYLMDLLS